MAFSARSFSSPSHQSLFPAPKVSFPPPTLVGSPLPPSLLPPSPPPPSVCFPLLFPPCTWPQVRRALCHIAALGRGRRSLAPARALPAGGQRRAGRRVKLHAPKAARPGPPTHSRAPAASNTPMRAHCISARLLCTAAAPPALQLTSPLHLPHHLPTASLTVESIRELGACDLASNCMKVGALLGRCVCVCEWVKTGWAESGTAMQAD